MSAAAGASGVGYYVVARSLTNLTLAPAVSTGLMVQATEKNAVGEIVRTRDLALAAAAFTLAGATLLALVGPWLIVFVFGADFAASGLLLRLTLIAVPALLMIRVFSAWNARSGVPERTSISVGITAIIFATAAIPAGRAFGTAGAVVVFVMAAWLQAAMLWTLHRRGLRA